MIFRKKNEELPPLEVISAMPIDRIIDLAPKLSISELLIIGSVPLEFSTRPDTEIRDLSGVIDRKIRQLERDKDHLSRTVVASAFPQFKDILGSYAIRSYLEKYQFIVSEILSLVDFRKFQPKTQKEIKRFKNILPDFGEEIARSRRTDELKNLEAANTNLRYLYHDYAFGKGLAVIGQKLKAPERIASKVAYCLIMQYRKDHEGEKIGTIGDLGGVNLNAPVIKDISGVQIILDAPYETGLKPMVNRLGSAPGVVICNRPGNKLENYYENNHGSYKAIHVPVFLDWNKDYKHKGQWFKDPVEVIIMEFSRFIEANFDPEESYWRRMCLQRKGIVSKEVHGGRLRMDEFTPFELKWKAEIEKRVMHILNYQSANQRR